MTKRTKIRKVMVRDNKSFYQIILQKLEPFQDFILALEVNFDLGGQRSLFKKLRNLMKNIAGKV